MHNGPSKYHPYIENAHASKDAYRSEYTVLQRKKGTQAWAYYVKWWQLWKIVSYSRKSKAIAHARLLKRKNPNMEYAVTYLETEITHSRYWIIPN